MFSMYHPKKVKMCTVQSIGIRKRPKNMAMFGLRVLRPRLGKTRFSLSFFFFFLLSAVKTDFFNHGQCICALFTDLQISLFINFFIKNGSHDIIHTFKNYFATMFFSFSFQFSVVYTEEYIFRIIFFFFILEGNNILLMISW